MLIYANPGKVLWLIFSKKRFFWKAYSLLFHMKYTFPHNCKNLLRKGVKNNVVQFDPILLKVSELKLWAVRQVSLKYEK